MDGIYFVYSGLVKVHKRRDTDKELILRFANPGTILGHRGPGGDKFYPVSATGLEPAIVCYLDIDFFIASLKVNHDYTYNLMMFYAEELKESEKRMRNMAHMPVKRRLAYALLLLKKKFGTTYETVFRTLDELAEENVITMSGKNILVNSKETLVSLSAENQS